MSDPRPIGVFDSGIGGLTVVHALRQRLPSEAIIYLGDTARVPYGTKSHATIERYTLQAGAVLRRYDPKLLVIACNTASAHGLAALERESPVPVIGVIEPGAELAAKAEGPVGVIGTLATVQSGAYETAIRQRKPDAEIHAIACPLLVALAEEGWLDDPLTVEACRRYLAALPPSVKTLVLGCTHYPVLRPSLEKAHPGLRWIDSGEAAAVAVERLLAERGAKREGPRGDLKVLLTDASSRLQEVGSRFLGEQLGTVEVVDI
ncbi:MAG TPA: glutamate racemase [Holophagaceae bacterium]|nr:glutamate racemase [Holophagaceae bacterium]